MHLMTHEPCADATGDPHLHCTPYERELDALTRQLIITSAVKYLAGHSREADVLAQARSRFRLIAGVAVALVDSGLLTRLKGQAAACVSEDRRSVYHAEHFADEAIQEFLGRLFASGEMGSDLTVPVLLKPGEHFHTCGVRGCSNGYACPCNNPTYVWTCPVCDQNATDAHFSTRTA